MFGGRRRRGFFSRIGEWFRGRRRPPPVYQPRQRPTAPQPSQLSRPPMRGGFYLGGTFEPPEPPMPPPEPELPPDWIGDVEPVEVETIEGADLSPQVGQGWTYRDFPGAQGIDNGYEVFYATPSFWYSQVETRTKESLIAEFGLDNLQIIDQLIQAGLWNNNSGSWDWERFRETYAEIYGYRPHEYSF